MADQSVKSVKPHKPRKKRRSNKGTLTAIAVLLIGSAVTRVGFQATAAIARESELPSMAADAAQSQPEGVQCETDPDLLPLLSAMEAREARILEREERITMRMRALTAADEKIAAQLEKLQEAERALRETIALADEAAETDLARLTAVYENMKPQDAAALFETMDPDFAAGFLGRMRPEAAAGIMTGLAPETAYTISVVLAGRNSSVPKE